MAEAVFQTAFSGTGSMKDFIFENVRLLEAMNNISVLMPPGYDGAPVTLKFNGSSLVLDFGDALVFTLANVEWVFPGIAEIVSNEAEVENGKLEITVDAIPDLSNVTWHLDDDSGAVDFDSYSVDLDNDTLNVRVSASVA